jgi:DNA-binding transcriptional ArsR family regulator
MASAQQTVARSAPIFAALGDETRLRLVSRLCAGGPQSIADLTAGVTVTRQAVTKHLHVLEAAGIARGVRKGRESRWEIAPGKLDVARRYLDSISQQWERRLAALERHLDEMPDG